MPGWASSQPQVPSTLGTLMPAQRGAGALTSSPLPVWVPQQPGTPCLLAQSTGAGELRAPFCGHPFLCPQTQPTPGSGHAAAALCSRALPELALLPSCRGTCWQSSGGLGLELLLLQLRCRERWRQSLHCHSSGSPKRHQVTWRWWLWGQRPLIQAMAPLSRQCHRRQLCERREINVFRRDKVCSDASTIWRPFLPLIIYS